MTMIMTTIMTKAMTKTTTFTKALTMTTATLTSLEQKYFKKSLKLVEKVEMLSNSFLILKKLFYFLKLFLKHPRAFIIKFLTLVIVSITVRERVCHCQSIQS
jgi:hypothetical protein